MCSYECVYFSFDRTLCQQLYLHWCGFDTAPNRLTSGPPAATPQARNAALVIRKRAISLILHSGTELVGARKNVLRPGANANSRKTPAANAAGATGCSSKKTAA